MRKNKELERQKVLLGRRIRSLRTAKGYTQEKLGELSGVFFKFIGEVERGQRFPSTLIIFKLADALDIAPRDLFIFEHEINDKSELLHAIQLKLGEANVEELRLIDRLIDAVVR
jgi:transcriptional regulator with XRE-family HTH domain